MAYKALLSHVARLESREKALQITKITDIIKITWSSFDDIS